MIVDTLYVIAGLLFIAGIKCLTKVRSAPAGNLLASLGMFVAIVTTLVDMQLRGVGIGWFNIALGVGIGCLVGGVLALRVQMTAMPELVSLFNGFGGGASMIVALLVLLFGSVNSLILFSGALSMAIGGVTFSASVIAFGKLHKTIPSRSLHVLGHHLLTGVIFVLILSGMIVMMVMPSLVSVLSISLVCLSLLGGVMFALPVGGANMPIVISLLNSLSGLAAASTGFVLQNTVLIIGGSLVGTSGLILTIIMCKAMNRTLGSVVFSKPSGEKKQKQEYTNVSQASPEEAALLLEDAKNVIMVPGYGMAVAQAQHALQELMEHLEKRKTKVKFAIHPVAGRMPGHMNVLLAEADVPYDRLFDLESINREFKKTEVVIVVGANDVVNPAASTQTDSPIYGMPVLNVDQAQTVLVIKRGLSPGFAGVKNELFERPNCKMVYGDAKQVVENIRRELDEL